MKCLFFKLYLGLVFAIAFVFILAGCAIVPEKATQESSQVEVVNPPTTEPTSDENSSETTDDLSCSFPINPVIFDFGVFPDDEFPRGYWSVNQLIDNYGIPETISAHYNINYMGGSHIVFVNVLFEGFGVYFEGEQAERFSFFDESIEDGSYVLSENDRDLGMEILYLQFIDVNTSFPHGIRIGETIKYQVLEAYPEDSAYIYQSAGMSDSGEEYKIDMVTFYYGFRDENGNLPEWVPPPWNPRFEIGNVDYLFDENGILISVTVQWRFFDI